MTQTLEDIPLISDMPHPVTAWSEFIARASAHGPLFRFLLNGEVALWLNDATLMRMLLKAPFSEVGVGPLIKGFESAGGLGFAITVNYSDSWRPRHRVLQRPLSHRGVRELGPLLQESLRTSLASWNPTDNFDPDTMMTDLILDALGATLFSGDHREFIDVIHAFDVERNSAFVMISQDPAYIPSDRPEFAQALGALDAFIYSMIAARRAAPREDLLSRIVTSALQGDEPMSDQELRDEVVGLIYAGHKTTANTLAFAACILATHPEVQEALAAQVAAIAGAQDFHERWEEAVPLASEIVTETLRLYPVGDLIDRTVVGTFDMNGVVLPEGLPVLFSTWIPHHNPEAFEAPEEFSTSHCPAGRMTDMQKDSYLPFSTGPKVCLGIHLATFEAGLALALLAERWSLGSQDHEALSLAHDPLLYARPWPRLSLVAR
jgi:cytochrome P450